MMAADSNKFPPGFITFVLFTILVSVAFSPASAQCTDGTYKHDGRDCCLCAAGLHLVEHCTTGLHSGRCDPCEPGTYSSYPNDQMTCERCTSCSHPSANLEEDEVCTPARDAKCRCKKDHYCASGKETCKLCHRCKTCGAEGIKVACAANNDTVCNDKIERGNPVVPIVSIIIPIVLLLLVILAVVFIRRRLRKRQPQTPDPQLPLEMPLLEGVDLQPHLVDIAQVIGWKDMHEIAVGSSIPDTTIDSCKLDHPGDSQEQTLQLLKTWVEAQGREASMKLIQNLQRRSKKGKAEKVTDILSHGK